MRKARISMAFCLFVGMNLVSSRVWSQEIAPLPPAVDETVQDTAVEPIAEPLPLPAVDDSGFVSASASSSVEATCCDYVPAATCCHADTYRCCCCGHAGCYMPGIHYRNKHGKLKWCRVWTTGDMHQHYAYYPAHHGTYYFRPYNYTNVLEHKEQVMRLGGERHNPYSVAMFDGVYASIIGESPELAKEPVIEDTLPGKTELPNIENLLLNE